MVWYSHLFQNFPQFIVIHTVKGFGIVNKAEIDDFLELSCVFHDPADVGNLMSGSSAFSKTSLNIWKFTVHVLLKPGLENLEHYLLACEMSAIVRSFDHSLSLPFFRIGMKTDLFPVLWPLLSFLNLLAYRLQHFYSSIFQDLKSSTGISSPPLALFIVMLPNVIYDN